MNIKSWREAAVDGDDGRHGLPSGDQGVSTTRITLPANLPPNAKPVDLVHVQPGEPHWPLVVMLVFTQLSVGAFAAIWILQLAGASTRPRRGA